MNITKEIDGTKLCLHVEGRLDTVTSPLLENELEGLIGGLTELVFDLEQLEYISSSGLRVILSAQKIMNKQGTMIVKNVTDPVQEIFDITGFTDILTIQ